jgi:RNA polymerase sigma factor (sigma-70 family)
MSETNLLLSEFVRRGCEESFRDLVQRYLGLVYSTAFRITGDKHLAEDVAQHVFIDLARKAKSLPGDVQLGGWLHKHTTFLARNAMRSERRRKTREREAVELHNISDYTEENIRQVTSVLDEAIGDLKIADRNLILLRFFEQLDFASLGARIKCGEDAARMRLSRALEKLTGLLRRRGFVLSASGLVFVLGAKSTAAAPFGLATKIAQVSISSAAKASWIVALKQACCTKLNVALSSAAIAVAITTFLILGDGPHAPQLAVHVPDVSTFSMQQPAAQRESSRRDAVVRPVPKPTSAADAPPARQPAPNLRTVSPVRPANVLPKTGPNTPVVVVSRSTSSRNAAPPLTQVDLQRILEPLLASQTATNFNRSNLLVQVLASAAGHSPSAIQLGARPVSLQKSDPRELESALKPLVQSARDLRDIILQEADEP